MDKEPVVYVIGGDHYNTYGIIRSLGAAGIKSRVLVLGCGSRRSFVLRSRHAAGGGGFLAHAEALDYLEKNRPESGKGIVICCSDEALELVLDNYSRLSKDYILPVCSDYGETARLMNKSAITSLAASFGMKVPQSHTVKDRVIPEGIGYPCITKPLVSTAGHKSDIVVCRSREELQAVVGDEKRCADYIVQDFIDYEKEVSILGAVLSSGEVRFSGCIDKLRTCMTGTTSFGVMIDNSLLGDNLGKLEALMKSTGFRGLFSAEFLVKDGEFYFLEVNFRNDGNTFVATASGSNLPLDYVRSAAGVEVPQDHPSYPCHFMLDIEDFLTLRRNGVSLRQWRWDIKAADAFLVYDRQDRRPFCKKLANTLAAMMRRFFGKIGIKI